MRCLPTVALLGVAVAAFAVPRGGAAQALVEQRCRLSAESLPAAFALCATLTVPLDPAAQSGESIDLFVARIAAQTSTPRPDPLVIISGGPGQSAVDFYLQARAAFEPARRDRDLVLLDQRGTGRSRTGFTCPVPEDLALETAGTEALERFVVECVASLEHDPRFYTTSVAVADLERLRAALGAEQWNIYGVSYGTRVAQHYLRRFPERTRSVVLDGVVPPDLALGPDVAREAQRALNRIFERCAEADSACAAKFADLPANFTALLARLESEPVPQPPTPAKPAPARQRLRRDEFGALHARALVRFLSYSATPSRCCRVLFTEAYAGNYAPLVGQARTTLRGLPESMSFPMSNSVLCTEDAPFIAPGATEGLSETVSRHDDRRRDASGSARAGPRGRSTPTSRRRSSRTGPCCCCPAIERSDHAAGIRGARDRGRPREQRAP